MTVGRLFHNLLLITIVLYYGFRRTFTRRVPPVPVSGGMHVKGLSGNLACCVHGGGLPTGQTSFCVTRGINSVRRRRGRHKLTRFLRRVYFGKAARFPNSTLGRCLRHVNIGFNRGLGTCATVSRAICGVSGMPIGAPNTMSSYLLVLRS